MGRNGFTDPELVETLKLTAKQKERIRKLQNEASLTFWDKFVQSAGQKKWTRSMSGAYWARAQDKVLAVFTEPQRKKWEEMAGTPISAEVCGAFLDGLAPRFPAPPIGPGRYGPPGRPGPPRQGKN
jgi:hypothetical protein